MCIVDAMASLNLILSDVKIYALKTFATLLPHPFQSARFFFEVVFQGVSFVAV